MPKKFLVDHLFLEGSINILAGDSGLGKTPLGISLGLSVASGKPFLGRSTTQGKVLYCDAETDPHSFEKMMLSLSGYAGLKKVPDDFFVWNPTWTSATPRTLFQQVEILRPKLVIVDPLRLFFPEMEEKGIDTAKIVRLMREFTQLTGCAWFLMHHLRKHSPLVSRNLEKDPHGWLQEVAGSHAIINHTDVRLGIEPREDDQLMIAGVGRGVGKLNPIILQREFDMNDDPIGYRPLKGKELLDPIHLEVFEKLGAAFRFDAAKNALGGNSDKMTDKFLKNLVHLGLVLKPKEKDCAKRYYVKV